MRVLPLSVLFYEGPMARAYLEGLHRSGFKVANIIRIVPKSGILGYLLPRGIRGQTQAFRQDKRANHWPRVLANRFPGLCAEMSAKIEQAYDLGKGFVEVLRSGRELEDYSDTVEMVELDDLKDPRLIACLKANRAHPILFTGGGLLPRPVFDIPDLQLIHIHPGLLPHVRGADGLLWSTLIRGRPGISAFVMAPGLDAGNLILAQETEPLSFNVPEDEYPSDSDLYRMIYSYYDPVLRVFAMRQLLPLLNGSERITGAPQDTSAGRTYHFAQDHLRHRALDRLFHKPGAVLAARPGAGG